MWKPKTVATTDNVYTYLRLFNLNYSEPILNRPPIVRPKI